MGDTETPELLLEAAKNSHLRGLEMNQPEPGGPKATGNHYDYLDLLELLARTQQDMCRAHVSVSKFTIVYFDIQLEIFIRPANRQVAALQLTAGWPVKQALMTTDLQLQADTVRLSVALDNVNRAQAYLDDMDFCVAACLERLANHKVLAQQTESLILNFPLELLTIITKFLLGGNRIIQLMHCRLCCKYFNKAGTIALDSLGAMSPLSPTPATRHQNFCLSVHQVEATGMSYFYLDPTYFEPDCVIVQEVFTHHPIVFVAVCLKLPSGAFNAEFVYQRLDSPGIYSFRGKFIEWTYIKHGLNPVDKPMFHKTVHLNRSEPAVVTCDQSVALHSWPISGYALMDPWNWAGENFYGEAYLDEHNVAQIRIVRGMSPDEDTIEYLCQCHKADGVVSFYLTNYLHQAQNIRMVRSNGRAYY
jgi:hypothetical protein